jgi:competence ComEA-like helix-hairpin-helix protein
MKLYAPEKNMSVLFLALACILYYLIASGSVSSSTPILHSFNTKYIEIEQGGRSTIQVINEPNDMMDISNIYNIKISNGDKIIIDSDGGIKTGRISGVKSISLGIPIGINSALAVDLTALPGIGSKTAEHIIIYRENSGGFNSLDELDDVKGIGKKTMESLKGKISLD